MENSYGHNLLKFVLATVCKIPDEVVLEERFDNGQLQ